MVHTKVTQTHMSDDKYKDMWACWTEKQKKTWLINHSNL